MDPKEELDPKKELNLPQREMIVAMHAAHSEMGKKKLTIEVNKLLPAKMKVEKYQVRDLIRSRDEPTNTPVVATKPRDQTFTTGTAYPIFHLLCEAEREYLLNLDNASTAKINPCHSATGRCHPVAHVRQHLVVLLVLLGFRPCHPFVSPSDEGNAIMSEMVIRCLVPLMEKFDLESYGFRLLYVATDVQTYDMRFRGFEGAWVLADTQSTGWGVVRHMFVEMPTAPIPPRMLCVALGFPFQEPNQNGDDQFWHKVEILDATEHALLKDHFSQHSCRVNMLKIFCGQGCEADWKRIADYYMACKDMTAALGTELALDLYDHAPMRVWCCMTGMVAENMTGE